MCSEIDLCSTFPKTMSSDSNSPRLIDLPLEKEEGIIEKEDYSENTENLREKKEQGKEAEETDKATVSSPEKRIGAEDDDDGFKTPTSADHRIPPITECPPAPRKARPHSSKRKASPPLSPPSGARRSLQFESSGEVESLFRPIPDQESSEDLPKVKRARRDDDEDSYP